MAKKRLTVPSFNMFQPYKFTHMFQPYQFINLIRRLLLNIANRSSPVSRLNIILRPLLQMLRTRPDENTPWWEHVLVRTRPDENTSWWGHALMGIRQQSQKENNQVRRRIKKKTKLKRRKTADIRTFLPKEYSVLYVKERTKVEEIDYCNILPQLLQIQSLYSGEPMVPGKSVRYIEVNFKGQIHAIPKKVSTMTRL